MHKKSNTCTKSDRIPTLGFIWYLEKSAKKQEMEANIIAFINMMAETKDKFSSFIIYTSYIVKNYNRFVKYDSELIFF